MKYTIKDFRTQFPTNDVCLDYVFKTKYPQQSQSYYRVTKRKCYANGEGKQIHPLKGTIFEKSSTPLTDWFYAIYLFSATKNGVSAKELQRQLGVTYKCAWRLARKIRELMSESIPNNQLTGTVEADEMYVGGKQKKNKDLRSKATVVGVVERQGKARIKQTEAYHPVSYFKFVFEHVQKNSRVITDEHLAYSLLGRHGYRHEAIKHKDGEYVRSKDIHTGYIDGLWSYMKRGLLRTFNGAVRRKYLQSYLEMYLFHYNHRFGPTRSLFQELIARV